jgi:plasmid stabilization system protein ParE
VPRNLRLTDEAAEDLNAFYRWYTQPGAGVAAARRVQALVAAIGRLREKPCLHAVGQRPGTREMAAGGHRVVYAVTPDTGSNRTAGDVMVLRVFGPSQSRDER